jgi:thiamine-phosphate pyrophosphorylase
VPAALPESPFLYPIVDVTTTGAARSLEVVRVLGRAGVRLLQLRAKDMSDRALVPLARAAVAAAHEAGAKLLVNDRPDIARIVQADGVHLGQDDLPPADARAVLGAEAIIGFSTHTLAQLRSAEREPIDYVALGPIFGTTSKANPDPVVGLAMLAQARASTSRPLVAIGGLTRQNASQVVAAGADGLAVIGDLLREGDLSAAVGEFAALLRARDAGRVG